MKNNYKSRTMLILFFLIATVNIFLFTIVFFSYANVLKNDYEVKLYSTTQQMASNVSRTLSFFEEEIEIFINKYNIAENLHNYHLEKATSIRTDSTSFDNIAIFRENTLVYADEVERADFYRYMTQEETLDEKMKGKDKKWIITENVEDVSGVNTVLCYVRRIQPVGEEKKHGYIVAVVSQKQLVNVLDIDNHVQNNNAMYFKPSFFGILLEEKILFLANDAAFIEEAYSDKKYLLEEHSEIYTVDMKDESEFFIAQSNNVINREILRVMIAFILMLVAIILSAYKVLRLVIDEISGRINSLNYKMENYSSKEAVEE